MTTVARRTWYAEIAIALLIIALVILCVFLVRQYRTIVRQETVSSERVRFADMVRHHTLSSSDAGLIEPWMTFAYVSVSFRVPSPYLMAALGISSTTPGYPNITLGRYSRLIATSSAAVADEVRSSVKEYLAATSTPNI